MAIQDFRLDAANVSFGRRERTDVTLVADVAGSLGGKHFTIDTPTTSYYVWFDSGASTDPAVAGKTGIQVIYTSGDSAIVLAGLLKTAMEAVSFWVKDNLNGSVEIEPKSVGAVTVSVDVDTTFTFAQGVIGFGGDLGRTSDGIEVTFEKSLFALNSNQTGPDTKLGEIKTGENVSIKMSLIEMTKQRWSDVVGSGAGNKYTPAGGTEVVGGGTGNDFANMFDVAGELRISPINTPDGSRDFAIWKCIPNPSSYSFSGTDLSTMAIDFSGYPDSTKRAEVSLYAFGDVAQDLRA